MEGEGPGGSIRGGRNGLTSGPNGPIFGFGNVCPEFAPAGKPAGAFDSGRRCVSDRIVFEVDGDSITFTRHRSDGTEESEAVSAEEAVAFFMGISRRSGPEAQE